MSETINNESKNNLAITNESKHPTGSEITWDQATFIWNDATGTWDLPGVTITKETKNSLTITNETKN